MEALVETELNNNHSLNTQDGFRHCSLTNRRDSAELFKIEVANLKDKSINPEDLSLVSLRQIAGNAPQIFESILEKYYQSYALSFRDPDELLPKSSVRHSILREAGPDITVVFLGEEVIAGYQTIVKECGGKLYSLGHYLWVDENYRKSGLGQVLYKYTIAERMSIGAVAHIGEVNDPLLMSEEARAYDLASGISPEGRVKFWMNQGRLAVNVPWIQPPLSEGEKEVSHLMLSIHPLTSDLECLTKHDVLCLWRAYYVPYQKYTDVRPTYHKLCNLIKGEDTFEFIPMNSKRTFLENENILTASGTH